MAQSESDTDRLNKAGYPYSRLIAESHGAVPSPAFDTAEIRVNQKAALETLVKQNQALAGENVRLIAANAELSRQVERLLAEKGDVHTPSHCEKCATGPASASGLAQKR